MTRSMGAAAVLDMAAAVPPIMKSTASRVPMSGQWLSAVQSKDAPKKVFASVGLSAFLDSAMQEKTSRMGR